MTARDLKNALLQEAVQGKLVPQIAAEGNAADLLNAIRKEKAELIKAGKLKKEKPLPPITDDEKPFDIPENWCWCRWGDLSESIQYGYNAPAKSTGRIRMVRISDIQNNEVVWGTVPFCDIDESEISTYLLKENDILFARTGGTVGKSFLVKKVPFESIYAGYLIRTRYSAKLVPQYLKFFMESQLYWEQLKCGTIATAQPNCNGQTLSKMLIPLPPLSEQKRIVAKLEEMLPLVEEYGKAQEELDTLNNEIPEKLKKAILQEAIQGKLVPQIASEGNAQDLLQKIEAERKKSNPKYKPLPPVTDEEKPFEIPESWVWVRLSSITSSILYGVSESAKTKGKYKLLRITDIQNNKVNWETVPFTDFEESKVSNYILQKDDILFARTGGTVGKSYLVNECPNNSIYASYLIRVRLFDDVYARYVKLFFESPFYWYQVIDKASGTGQPNCNGEKLTNLVLPLPPLSEQKRIVAKLEELLGEVEKLKR